jgi:hypothetical protein
MLNWDSRRDQLVPSPMNPCFATKPADRKQEAANKAISELFEACDHHSRWPGD